MKIKTVAVVAAGMAAMTALSQGRDTFVQQQAYTSAEQSRKRFMMILLET